LDVTNQASSGKQSLIRLSLFRRLGHTLMATLESLILPSVFFALALIGLAIMGGLAWLTWLDLFATARVA